jgi:hypothetical protein
VLDREFEDYVSLIAERQRTELKLAQKEQFIRATINMLPEDDREVWEIILENLSSEEIGLSDAIRGVLRAAPKKYHTATEVRKALAQGNFDFARYTTNPLSSVHAALRRLKPEEAETEKIDGVMTWRWIGPVPAKNALAERLLNEIANVASGAAIYGGSATDSPENQPFRFPSSQRPRKTLGQRIAEETNVADYTAGGRARAALEAEQQKKK